MARATVKFDNDHSVQVEGSLDEIEEALTGTGDGIWRAKRDDREILIVVDHVREVVPYKDGDNSGAFT